MAELADALDSGSSGSNLVEVQVLSPALFLFLALDLSDFSERSFLFYLIEIYHRKQKRQPRKKLSSL